MDTQGLYDIYDAVYVPFWQRTSWYVALIAAGSICCGALLVFALRAYRARKKVVPAWQKALQGLDALGDVQMHEGKDFYCTLTTLVKTYLHERYGYDVRGATDDELLLYVAEKPEMQRYLDDIRAICVGCVTIKFAHAQAGKEQMKQDLERARTLVLSTRATQTT